MLILRLHRDHIPAPVDATAERNPSSPVTSADDASEDIP